MKRWLSIAAMAALLAACGSPAKLNYYTLAAESQPSRARPASSALTVYVGPVTLPEAVDRPQMVRRIAANQVEIADLDRWAEPLKAAVPRLVADTLAAELGAATVMTSRQSATLTFDYRVAIDVQRFEFSAEDGALVEALWTIRTAKDAPPRTGRSEARERGTGGDPQSMAAAQSRAVEKLARDIAATIGSMAGR